MTRKEFQHLATLRLKESQLLLEKGCPSGAFYLAGYVAESGLKACIAKRTVRHEFPDKARAFESYTHNLTELIAAAGLKSEFAQEAYRDEKFREKWTVVRKWTEISRYETKSENEAAILIDAISNRKHGLFQWLKRYW